MNKLQSNLIFVVLGLVMAGNVLLGQLRQLGKKRWGKRFQQFRRDAPNGNPRDPLIGFPFVFLPKPETDNQKLISDHWFMNLE
ncbi:MAG: hypothetical protein WB755_15445 [Terriglobales bacterium]